MGFDCSLSIWTARSLWCVVTDDWWGMASSYDLSTGANRRNVRVLISFLAAAATTFLLCNIQRVKCIPWAMCTFIQLLWSGRAAATTTKKNNKNEKMKTHWKKPYEYIYSCNIQKIYIWIHAHRLSRMWCDTSTIWTKRNEKQANTIYLSHINGVLYMDVECSNPSDPICCWKFLIHSCHASLSRSLLRTFDVDVPRERRVIFVISRSNKQEPFIEMTNK